VNPPPPKSVVDAAIARASAPGSRYWLHLHRKGLDLTKEHEVEVRIDAPAEVLDMIAEVPGWSVAKVKAQQGMLFLRRRQALTDDAVQSMFAELITLAHQHSGRFHSWMHEPDLVPW
jgi:hypothetical protein